jgi:hypothetical protein
VFCTSGSGMLRMRASIRVARLRIHGIMPAGDKVLLDREGVLMGHLL